MLRTRSSSCSDCTVIEGKASPRLRKLALLEPTNVLSTSWLQIYLAAGCAALQAVWDRINQNYGGWRNDWSMSAARRSSFVDNVKVSSTVPQFQGKYGGDQAQRDEIGDHEREIAY